MRSVCRLGAGMRVATAAAAALVAAACSPDRGAPDPAATSSPVVERSAEPSGASPGSIPAGMWEMVSSGEGDGLFFGATEGEPAVVHMFCPRDGGLLINVHRFTPVGSEERLSFGSGGTVVALVADTAGDALRGGVSGEGPVPAELQAILTGPDGVGVNYGAQNFGPLPPVPEATARAFVAGCGDRG